MELLIAFVAGAVVAFLVARAMAHPPAQQEGHAQSPTARLQALTGTLAGVGDASSHPRDLSANATFQEAVAILGSDVVPMSVVMDYAAGANFMLSTAACAALCERPDRDAASTLMERQFRHLSPWPIYYALQYFTRLSVRPPLGSLVLHGSPYWSEHPLVAAMLAEHFAARLELGDTPGFGDALSGDPPPDLAATESLLRKIEHPSAHALMAALTAWRRNALDRTFLQTFGRFVESDPGQQLLLEHSSIKEPLATAEDSLLNAPFRSVLAVGEPRAGKTSFLILLAMRAAAQGWAVFEAGAASLMAGQQYFGQLEERLHRLTTELAVEKRVLWYVPDFLQLAASGTHTGTTATLLDQMLPAIASGRVVVLSEATPAGLTTLLQRRPAIRSALELVRLPPLSDVEVDRLAREVASRLSATSGIAIDPDVLNTVMHLARHYLGTAQMPGAALDLIKLDGAARCGARRIPDAARGRARDLVAIDRHPAARARRSRARRSRRAARILRGARHRPGRGVDAVVDRIAMLKAGLTDPGRPIAVFLFAGPTGTGKTELAKTLAEFLFGSAERLIRLDMSEFQAIESTRRRSWVNPISRGMRRR